MASLLEADLPAPLSPTRHWSRIKGLRAIKTSIPWIPRLPLLLGTTRRVLRRALSHRLPFRRRPLACRQQMRKTRDFRDVRMLPSLMNSLYPSFDTRISLL